MLYTTLNSYYQAGIKFAYLYIEMTIINDDLKDMRISITFSFALILFVLVCLMLPAKALPASFGQSHETHWWDDRGPQFWTTFPNPPMGCTNCHYDDTPHHGNPYQFADMQDLANTTVCDDCHSQGGAYDGVAMAKDNWNSGIYTGDNLEYLPSEKEQWCVTCHDDAAPTINGVTGKNVSGDNIAYGYFVSGHGNYNVLCTDCHDPRLIHFDGYDSSYASTGNYREGYRLTLINDKNPMDIPRISSYNANQFRLCYSCHDESAIITINPLFTDFADIPNTSQKNLHNYHLNITNRYWDSDGSGEPGGMKDSAISCPTCHNPHGKDYNSRATISMTRQDMGIVHHRDTTGLFGFLENPDWGSPGGDLNCFNMCHASPSPTNSYYFHLGTPVPQNPGFWTKLDSGTDVTNPTYGTGGTLLGGTFVTYDKYGVTETGLNVVNATDGCEFPATNLSADNDLYGETIDFWYVPNFNFSGNTTVRFLFNYYYGTGNLIKIRVVNEQIYFEIKKGGTVHTLASDDLPWDAGTPHHIVCTWGPAQGMHMYLDRKEPDYSINDGLSYFEGITQVPTSLYIGIQNDGTNPANGIIDDFKMYGYQYEKFENGLSLFSKMGSAAEIQTPVLGDGGSIQGTVDYGRGQQGKSTHFYVSGTTYYDGVVRFPTSATNLNPAEDTVDFWYSPYFTIEDNTDSRKHIFWYNCDADNRAYLKVDEDTFNFTIREGGTDHTLRTTSLTNWDWFHIVCTWGPDGMHIYLSDREATYSVNDGLSYTGGLPTVGMPANLKFGNQSAGDTNYCQGFIDEVRIYGFQGTPQYLEFLTDCPVDIQVIDPLGRIVDKFQNEIRGAQYIEYDFNSDGSLDDKIIVPKRHGNYTVSVFPEPGANPEDTYTLKVIDGENIIVLVKDEPVGNISGENMTEVTVTSSGLKFIKLLSPKNGETLSGPLPFDWESVGYDSFRLQFSIDRNFRKYVLNFPRGFLNVRYRWNWISETNYTPTAIEWRLSKILLALLSRTKVADKGVVVYWRVIAADAEGNTGSSEIRSFMLQSSHPFQYSWPTENGRTQ